VLGLILGRSVSSMQNNYKEEKLSAVAGTVDEVFREIPHTLATGKRNHFVSSPIKRYFPILVDS
jgi:hypothetical protein